MSSTATGGAQQRFYADLLFPKVLEELCRRPDLVGKVHGYIVATIKGHGAQRTWHIVFRGKEHNPMISTTAPSKSDLEGLSVLKAEIEDKDMVKMITGGMTGIKAYTSKKLKIEGDLQLARQMEDIFVKAGGVEKVMAYIRERRTSKL